MMRSPVPARFSRPFLVSATLCAGLFLAGCGGAKESTAGGPKAPGSSPAAPLKVSFQLDWYPAPEHGGHYQALVKNYYRDGGLDVTIVAGGPGAFGIQKVATGEMQFAMGRCDDIIVAVQRGLPLLIVGTQMQHDPQAIMVHEDSPVKSFRDLDGKSVMGSPGVNWIAFLQGHYGINFNVVPLDYGLARFVADKNFIQQCFISNEPYHVGLHGVKARALLIADGGYDPYRVIFTNKAFARTNPEAVRAFVAASTRGWVEFLHGDAAEARDVASAHAGLERVDQEVPEGHRDAVTHHGDESAEDAFGGHRAETEEAKAELGHTDVREHSLQVAGRERRERGVQDGDRTEADEGRRRPSRSVRKEREGDAHHAVDADFRNQAGDDERSRTFALDGAVDEPGMERKCCHRDREAGENRDGPDFDD